MSRKKSREDDSGKFAFMVVNCGCLSVYLLLTWVTLWTREKQVKLIEKQKLLANLLRLFQTIWDIKMPLKLNLNKFNCHSLHLNKITIPRSLQVGGKGSPAATMANSLQLLSRWTLFTFQHLQVNTFQHHDHDVDADDDIVRSPNQHFWYLMMSVGELN